MSTNRDSLAVLPPVTDRVSAGIGWLDHVYSGWDEEVNLDLLCLCCCERCILGQLFGRYGDGLEALELDDDDAVEFGFDRHTSESPAVYDELTAAWMDAIRARREVTR